MKILIVALSALMLCGCGTIREKFGAKAQPFITTTNEVADVVVIPATTNLVQVPAQVNASGEIVQAAGVVEVVTPAKLLTNWVKRIDVQVSPVYQQGITGAQSLNSKFNPTPSAPFVEWGLTALASGMAWWATVLTRKKNEALAKAQEHQEEVSKKQDLLHTIIIGVEEANLPAVKESIAKVSRQWQNRDALEAEVQRVTKS